MTTEYSLVESGYVPLTQDLADGVTTFFDADPDTLPGESGEVTIFDNTGGKVLFSLDFFNTSTTALDNATALCNTYGADGYAMTMTYTWLASEVAALGSVGWCLEAESKGASCWLLTKDANGAYTAANESYFIADADFVTGALNAWVADDLLPTQVYTEVADGETSNVNT
jgi:hypothetical protein